MACIVDDRLDRQINYVANNFTNMQIGIYLPEIKQLAEGFDTMSQQLGSKENTSYMADNIRPTKEMFEDIETFGRNLISDTRNSALNKGQLNEFSTSVNNPFQQIEKLFDQTPLVNITSRDVVVNVPMIYSEDIERYEAFLE